MVNQYIKMAIDLSVLMSMVIMEVFGKCVRALQKIFAIDRPAWVHIMPICLSVSVINMMAFHINNSLSSLSEEWSSVFDIGKTVSFGQVTCELYTEYERSVVSLLNTAFILSGESIIRVTDLEGDQQQLYEGREFSLRHGLDPIDQLDIDELKGDISVRLLPDLCRVALREQIWFKIVGRKLSEIHFGYDLNAYLKCQIPVAQMKQIASSLGVFCVETNGSPYDRSS